MHSAPPQTLLEVVRARAGDAPRAVAVLAPNRPALDSAGLAALCDLTARQLAARGVTSRDRVALVLQDGAEAAAAFVAVASTAACAPVNPGLAPAEIARLLAALRPRAILLPETAPFATAAVARESGAATLGLRDEPSGPAGLFRFAEPAPAPKAVEAPTPEAVALVLHTSGTTARPKRVPLTQANLLASARHVAGVLGLGPDDRCLDVMPLFHIHGLVAGLLAPLVSGGSAACPGPFEAVRFFDWLEALAPTWYTAVPTMHQAILAHAPKHAAEIARARLRFVRSSSSALPPAVLERLEATFGVPVIEAYGMTEAAHQMASNPLPPRPRKPGSVGLPAGPEVAILDARGVRLPAGATGEVAVRGPNVMAAYEDAPEANAAAFSGGLFRTGDLGAFDADGYLFLRGRIKELINRGGEKIAPREVEEALTEHPAVAEAVAFPVPDEALGEAVGAAVVLSPGAHTSLRELRAHAAARLSAFKVPRHLALLAEIPKGPTGKIQRSGLAERLGLGVPADDALDHSPARTPLEARLCALWAEVLRVGAPGIHAGFLECGGDSLSATRLLARVQSELGAEVSLARFFEAPSVAGLATAIEERNAGERRATAGPDAASRG